jgi:hypothetical protein
MVRRSVKVTFLVDVELDETKFTEEWMEEFRETFFPLFDVNDHAEHIAQLEAREVLDSSFTEGYGPLESMGIKAEVVDMETKVVDTCWSMGEGVKSWA